MSDDSIEKVPFDCGICKQPVITKWNVPDGGLMSDPSYQLVGDVIFHTECWDKYCEDHKIDFYVSERDALLSSPNIADFLAFCDRWGIEKPRTNIGVWAVIHKSRAEIKTMSRDLRYESLVWLQKHNDHRFGGMPISAADLENL